MARRKPCDACGAPRLSWQRLCNRCFTDARPHLRRPLLDAWAAKNTAAWRAARAALRAYLHASDNAPIGACRTATPQRAYANHARLIGEKE